MAIGGLDIGGTKIAVGIVDEGRVVTNEIMPTQPELGLAHALERIQAAFERQLQLTGLGLDGIGIGCTGPVDPLTGELAVNAFLPGWEGCGLINTLRKHFHLSVAMENDADAAALAEGRFGSGKGSHCFLYVTVSTGIGGGLLLDGRLFRGAGGAHPELGHHVIDPSGPACFCGASGCWEVLASGPAMARWYQQHRSLLDPSLDAARICQQARAGEALAMQAVARTGRYLGLGMANLITLFTPDRIALGGGMIKSWDLFEPSVQAAIRQNCGLVPFERMLVAPAALGADIGLLGAAQAWIHRYIP